MEAAEPGRCDEEFYLPENIGRSQMESFLHGIQTQSPNGILGDPVGSTAEAGDELLELVARALAHELQSELAPIARTT
jgi:creatinine amidohydrolase/Fe(II)-dependent formamide hydrolase-like protein